MEMLESCEQIPIEVHFGWDSTIPPSSSSESDMGQDCNDIIRWLVRDATLTTIPESTYTINVLETYYHFPTSQTTFNAPIPIMRWRKSSDAR